MRSPDLFSRELAAQLARMEPDRRRRLLGLMTPDDLLRFDSEFEAWAARGQRAPDETGWRTWLMLAGRGFGKTRAAADGSPASRRSRAGECGSRSSERRSPRSGR